LRSGAKDLLWSVSAELLERALSVCVWTQYKNGSLSSANTPNDTNMFLYYKNFGTEAKDLHIIRATVENECLKFKEEIIPTKLKFAK
jgi:hypothetical protein